MMAPVDPPVGSFLKCFVCVSDEGRTWTELIQGFTKESDKVEKNLAHLQTLLEKAHVKPSVICRGCNMQRYCSLSHLVADRQEHKPLCEVLRDLQKSMKIDHPLKLLGQITDRRKLQLVISQLKMVLLAKLGRPLNQREHQLIGNPAVCDVCFSTDALEDCEGCAGVAFCSAAHQRLVRGYHTPEDCQTLALIATPFRQLNCLVNIKDFYRSCPLKESNLIKAFTEATDIRISDTPWTDLESYQLFATCSSFSGIASLCLALSHISWVPDPNKAVIVYVAGATEDTLRYFEDMHLRFLFLQYPSIRNLELHFIGRTVGRIDQVDIKFSDRSFEQTVVKCFYPLSFSQYSCILNVDPTLILIMQPDFFGVGKVTQRISRYMKRKVPLENEWKPCLSSVIRSFGVPICYTSISRAQAISDFAAITLSAGKSKIAIERAYNIMGNPYREILPLHNPAPEDTERIVYANNYLEVIFTSKKKCQ
uniref:RE27943p n=1 Tax=Drosophila melanogaster TaxID=7227 RepID=Q8SYY5_DROME|nr:RE27943p [Drosophila melanogaster]